MKMHLKAAALALGLAMAYGQLAMAANVPAGVQLHA